MSLEYGERVSPAPRDALPRMFFPQIAQNITDRRHFTELATGGLCNSSNTWSSLTFRQSWSTLPPGCQHWAILGRSLAEVDGRLARHLPKHCCGESCSSDFGASFPKAGAVGRFLGGYVASVPPALPTPSRHLRRPPALLAPIAIFRCTGLCAARAACARVWVWLWFPRRARHAGVDVRRRALRMRRPAQKPCRLEFLWA